MSGGAAPVVIAGGRGLVGSALVTRLRAEGRAAIVLTRGVPGSGERAWDPRAPDPTLFDGAAAVVNLAGADIGRRWTPAVRRAILESRVDATRRLVESMARAARPPRVLIAASAVGFYGDRGDQPLEESSAPGHGFLADLTTEWERAAAAAEAHGTRVARLRFGLVLAPRGGALDRMMPIFRLGLGGPIGNGRQWWSWIAIDDLVEILRAAIADGGFSGPINAVAPEPVRMREFARTLGRVLSRPALLPVPAFALRLIFGAMAGETLLASQRVMPRRLIERGWTFQHPGLEGALRHLLRHDRARDDAGGSPGRRTRTDEGGTPPERRARTDEGGTPPERRARTDDVVP